MADEAGDPVRLPQYADEQRLEAESLIAVRNLLSPDKFVVRDRLEPDFGVDGQLELIDNGYSTNFVVPFQVKARSKVARRRDGVRTLQIPSATLQYLLNAPIALVFLYDAAAKTIQWAVASHEYQRLHVAGVDPDRQGSVTLEFTRSLDLAGAAQLHQELLLTSKALRKVRRSIATLDPDALAHVTAASDVTGASRSSRRCWRAWRRRGSASSWRSTCRPRRARRRTSTAACGRCRRSPTRSTSSCGARTTRPRTASRWRRARTTRTPSSTASRRV